MLVPIVCMLSGGEGSRMSRKGRIVRGGGALVVNNVYYKFFLVLKDSLRRVKVRCAATKGTKFVATLCVLVIPVLKLTINGGTKVGM